MFCARTDVDTINSATVIPATPCKDLFEKGLNYVIFHSIFTAPSVLCELNFDAFVLDVNHFLYDVQ